MILVDTNFFIAIINQRDSYHKRANEILDKLLLGDFGERYTISDVFTETATLLFKKTKRKEIVEKAWELIYSEEFSIVQPIIVNKKDIDNAWVVFQKYATEKRPLSFVDCLLIAVCQSYEIDSIVSFDSEFDGILKREC